MQPKQLVPRFRATELLALSAFAHAVGLMLLPKTFSRSIIALQLLGIRGMQLKPVVLWGEGSDG
jgi:hypothetical protein